MVFMDNIILGSPADAMASDMAMIKMKRILHGKYFNEKGESQPFGASSSSMLDTISITRLKSNDTMSNGLSTPKYLFIAGPHV